MKKIIIFGLVIILGGTLIIENVSAEKLYKGMRNSNIKSIQEILSQDSQIYPQQLKTGYFGNLTEQAIKRLQRKISLPETGVIDDVTKKFISPNISLTLTSPNGGEILDRKNTHKILWKVKTTPIKDIEILEEKLKNAPWFPAWFKIRIDLYQKVNETKIPKFVKHIATTNLFNCEYNWKISNDIPNGDSYIIKISSFYGYKPIINSIHPFYFSDESDATFSISGKQEMSCSLKCKSLGYDYGACRTCAIYPGVKPCKSEERDIGKTSDCPVSPNIIGIQKSCCCGYNKNDDDIQETIKLIKEAIEKLNKALKLLTSSLLEK